MKKISWPLLIITVAMLLSCQGGGTATFIPEPTPTSTTSANITDGLLIPDDFYIIYETVWFPAVMLLNTKDNIIGTPPWDVYVSTGYCIPYEDLQTIYNAVIEYDIKSYSGDGLITEGGVVLTPSINYVITFCLDGKTYSIIYNERVINKGIPYPTYPQLRSFHHILNDCYLDNYYKSPIYFPSM